MAGQIMHATSSSTSPYTTSSTYHACHVILHILDPRLLRWHCMMTWRALSAGPYQAALKAFAHAITGAWLESCGCTGTSAL